MHKKSMTEEFQFSLFSTQFAFNIDLLNCKLSHLERLNSMEKQQQFEYLTIFDSVVTQIRAMLLERGKKNYTFQNYFKEIGKPEIAERIDNLLDEPFDPQNSRSIRTALKFISDKFICHLDEIDSLDLGHANYIMSVLSNPHSSNSLNKILKSLIDIINCNQ